MQTQNENLSTNSNFFKPWKTNSKLLFTLFTLITFLLLITLTSSKNQILVHVIPHTHDDAGWLATFDNYYSGRNSQSNCVECILNTMLKALKENPTRTFTYTEISFFEKWYNDQTEEDKLSVKKFVQEKRLEFLSGGWVMNDEAAAYYQDIIDQIRLGMLFLKKEFDYVPKVAWYLDPFGHSLSNAYLMNKLGYENLVIVRIDYRDKEKRISEKKMEFLWKPYEDIDKGKSAIFTHITYGHYNPEKDFPDMLERYTISETSMRYKLGSIWDNINKRSDAYDSEEIMLLYGDDFTFGNDAGFVNMETLMKVVSEHPQYKDKMKFIYSTPIRYFNSIKGKKEISTFPTYENKDFFPYADGLNEYWTGYFTSRPYLKGIIRDAGNYLKQSSRFVFNYVMQYYLNMALESKQNEGKKTNSINEMNTNANLRPLSANNPTNVPNREFFSLFNKRFFKNFDTMRRELGIAQHHDAVTGTARNDVSDDYINRLNKGISAVSENIKEILLEENFVEPSTPENLEVCLDATTEKKCVDRIFTESELDKGFLISVINPGVGISFGKNLKISVNENSAKRLIVKEILKDNSEKEIEFDLFYEKTLEYFVVYFIVDFSNVEKNDTNSDKENFSFRNFSFKLENSSNGEKFLKEKVPENLIKNFTKEKPYEINFKNNQNNLPINEEEEKKIEIFIEENFLKIQQKKSPKEEYTIKLAHAYSDYHPKWKNCQGAYMMTTDSEYPEIYKINFEDSFISQGKILTKINIKFPYSTLIVKIYTILPERNYSFELQSILHKFEPSGQKEFFLILQSDLDNTSLNDSDRTEFFTDTNGMRVVKRLKNYRDTFTLDSNDDHFTGNFYPINSLLYINDRKNPLKSLYVFNDRSQAGSSVHKGEIIFDISRWGDRDDRRGLADGLYEYQSSRRHFEINHLVAFSKGFDYDQISNYMQNKPLSVFYPDYKIKKNSENSKRNLSESELLLSNFEKKGKFDIKNLFKFSNEKCFIVNYYMLSEKKFLFQFYNRSDPNFFEYEKCWVKLNRNDLFKVKVSQLNGVELKKNKIIPNSFLKKRFFAPLENMTQDLIYEETGVNEQDFYSLVIEFD